MASSMKTSGIKHSVILLKQTDILEACLTNYKPFAVQEQ